MKKLILLALFGLSLASCTNSSDEMIPAQHATPMLMPNDNPNIKYWYYYKSITLGAPHGGTFISSDIYNIGDQVAGDDGEVIEVTSEKHLLKN
jgi:hypothetical protein